MAFKMKGDPMKRNFGISPMKFGGQVDHSKVKLPDDAYAKAKKKDPKLDEYIKQRKNLKKGTAEYNEVQNKINAAYGVSKRHSTVTSTNDDFYRKRDKAYINLMRHDKPHRYHGLSDERIAQILRKERKRKERKAKFKPGTSDPR
tara:strand:+ start:406 stop:840 length:435 start_codon:yes stop_codon:yes gene_type:complete